MQLKKILLLLVLVGLSACGRPPVVDVPQEFSPYVSRFEATALAQGKLVQVTDLVVKFGDMANPNERGVCQIVGDNPPTITIDQAAWTAMSDDERESLVFHELGHCVLRRSHLSGELADGAPASVMNPYTLDTVTYADHIDYYHHELFTQENNF